ncbi:hypothetical protein ACFZB4_18445 [Streptomyces pseudovenezuelae]|uniref:hypothetical protein n=1 Tax=Streptomyces pseudovenezuelae TaxID=67350 RepID=UPI0036F11932
MPEHTSPYVPFANTVVSCSLTIDGIEYTARQAYSRSSWQLMKDDPEYRKAIEADIRRALGELIMRELTPPVVVEEPIRAPRCDIGRAAPRSRTCASFPDCTCGG